MEYFWLNLGLGPKGWAKLILKNMQLKNSIILKIILIVICLGLSLAIYIHSKGLNSSQCNIKLNQNPPGPIDHVNAEELAEGLNKDRCVVEWIPTQGWRYNGLD